MQPFDLSHPLATDMPVYPGTESVRVEPAATREADGYRTTRFDLDSHAGTHVDAPAHLTDGPSLDELSAERFRFDATTVDVRPCSPREAIGVDALRDGFTVDPDETVDSTESAGIDELDLLLVVTGWDRHWGDERYFDHPFLTEAAGSWLAERGLDLGVDAINPDPTPTANATPDEPDGFPVHEALFDRERVVLENLRGLERLPWRVEVHAYPHRFEGGDASPVRAVAFGPGEPRP